MEKYFNEIEKLREENERLNYENENLREERDKLFGDVELLEEQVEILKEYLCRRKEVINKYEEINKLDNETYHKLGLLYEELIQEYRALCGKTMGFKIDYEDENNFHIDYGDITPAIARHLLNSKTLKEIANKE